MAMPDVGDDDGIVAVGFGSHRHVFRLVAARFDDQQDLLRFGSPDTEVGGAIRLDFGSDGQASVESTHR
jgi:hypothetical protein